MCTCMCFQVNLSRIFYFYLYTAPFPHRATPYVDRPYTKVQNRRDDADDVEGGSARLLLLHTLHTTHTYSTAYGDGGARDINDDRP